MRLDNIPTVYLARANAAVIGTLRGGKASLGPSVWPSAMVKQSVFLLEAEPQFVILVSFHKPRGVVAIVELVGGSVWIPGLAHDNHVGGEADRVREYCDRADKDVRVFAPSLAGRRAVKVPLWELFDLADGLGEGLNGRGCQLPSLNSPWTSFQNGVALEIHVFRRGEERYIDRNKLGRPWFYFLAHLCHLSTRILPASTLSGRDACT